MLFARHLAIGALTLTAALPLAAQTLSYLGQQVLPTGERFKDTAVGGLSSLDFNPETGRYLAISDDRSEFNPARFYELALDLSQFRRSAQPGHAGVHFTGVTPLLAPDGKPFAVHTVDPEGLRLDRRRGVIYWSNEGQRTSQGFQNPTLRRMTPDGRPAGDFAIPDAYLPRGSAGGLAAGDSGIYNNLAFESVAISPDGQTLWTMTEDALTQDGLIAAPGRGSHARMLSFDIDSGKPGAEYVYEIGPVPLPPAVSGDFSTNGVSDMLALSAHEFIAIERSYAVGASTPGISPVTGKPTGNTIRLYRVDVRGATNVAGWPSIKGREWVPVKRELLLDLSSLKNDDGSTLALDNLEGITFGPTVGGKRTLVLVSDNNFNAKQFTQFVALTIE